jgi:ABC-type nitrate/sulfonate/bicarbonate transport system substrate-binding protein
MSISGWDYCFMPHAQVMAKEMYNVNISEHGGDFPVVQIPPYLQAETLKNGDVQSAFNSTTGMEQFNANGDFRLILGPLWKVWKDYSGHEISCTLFVSREEWFNKNKGAATALLEAFSQAVNAFAGDVGTFVRKYSGPGYAELDENTLTYLTDFFTKNPLHYSTPYLTQAIIDDEMDMVHRAIEHGFEPSPDVVDYIKWAILPPT